MNLKAHFSRFLGARPGRLHFAAHSHHPWPDVSFDAQQRAWFDAAELMDDKWAKIFGDLVPSAASRVAAVVGLSDPAALTFAPNTHELLVRIFSCLDPPVRVLSTDAEFHSFNRQSRRWEEAGLAVVDRVPAEPFETFAERFTREARAGAHDLIYLSQIFYDSGFVVPNLDRIVASVPEDRAYIVIDGYHGFMARPTHIGAIQERVFYLAGGYKYAMAGEGACFLHVPPGYGARPVDTGWYAGFGQLETGVTGQVVYAEDGTRFSGATTDPSGIYRLDAVLEWLEAVGVTVADIHAHAAALQQRFLAGAELPGELLPPEPHPRGNFLTFRTEHAGDLHRALHERDVITDHRADRLRIGFGIYHDEEDVDRLLTHLTETVRGQIST
jgi:kynureninase